MNSSELRQGVAYILDLERNDYMIRQAVNALSKNISELGIKRNIGAPSRNYREESFMVDLIAAVGILGIVGALGGAVYEFIAETNGWVKLFSAFGGAIHYGLYGAAAGIPAGIVVYFVRSLLEKQKIERAFESEKKDYEQKLQRDEARVRSELRQRIQLEKQLAILNDRHDQTRKLLNLCYDRMNIDDSFANLKAAYYMNEMLRLNITDHLDGVDGLYYLVGKELQAEKLQTSIDDISRKLDRLIGIAESYESYLSNISARCNQMVASTQKAIAQNERIIAQNEQIVANTAITAYNTERIAAESECMLFLNTLYYL